MSKNMTRRSLAIGSGLALIASGFAAAPAMADVEGFITLAPTTGFSGAYAVTAADGATFSLTATQGPSAIFTNKELKFLVTDPEAKFEPTADVAVGTGRTVTFADNSQVVVTIGAGATDVITITDASEAAKLETGDVISFQADPSNDEMSSITKVADDDTAFTVTIDGDDVKFTSNIDLSTEADLDGLLDAELTAEVIREKRGTDNSFVVDTGVSDGTATALVLEASDGVTRTVTVQAWVDFTENDVIDELDYVSPPRTVTFVADADLTGSFSLTAPSEGDTSLTGTASTTPLINGVQDGDDTLLGVVFTRQESAIQAFEAIDISTQNTTTGLWTVSVNTAEATALTQWTSATAAPAAVSGSKDWGFTDPTDRAAGAIGAVSVTAAKVATVTTDAAHNLRTGDKITYTLADIAVMNETAATVTVTSATTFTYPLSETADVTAATDADETDGEYAVVLSSANVFPGDYSGQLAVDDGADGNFTKVGTASTAAVLPVAAADVSFSTVASEVLQGTSGVTSNDTTTDALVVNGTTSATVTATVLNSAGAAVGAGRSVAYSFDAGVSVGTIEVNGYAQADAKPALTTDANGQVTFTVTDTTGTDGKKVTITATPEGVDAAVSAFSLEWEKPAITMYDLNISSASGLADGSRTVDEGTSYDLALYVADQWFNQAAAGDYRLAVSGGGVTEGFVNLVDGRATVTVSDSGVSSSYVSTITLQKKGTTGVFANTSTSVDLTTNTTDKGALNMSADGSSIYGTAADLSDAVASAALVERDTRTAFVAQPAYTSGTGGDVVVVGKATNSSTGVALANSVVTLSGPNNILFSNGAVDNRGGITVVSDGSGQFAVTLYSTSAQTDSVITATANGVSATTKVSFTGQGVGEGTVLTIDTPANVAPAGTFQVKANLADAFGNGVDTAADRMKVTYTGAGIYFGTLPTQTDASGNLSFSVLLGANDTGTITVTVSYDQNGDGDFVDTKDLTTTKTITIGGSSDQKVNAGSFKGYVAVYALGYEGSRLSAKIGNDWVIVDPIVNNESDNLFRVTDFTGAGVDIAVRIYIDRVLIDTINLTTK